jgi:hypothetical protein
MTQQNKNIAFEMRKFYAQRHDYDIQNERSQRWKQQAKLITEGKVEEYRLMNMGLEWFSENELKEEAQNLPNLDDLFYTKNPFISQECYNFVQIVQGTTCENSCCKIKSDFIKKLQASVETCGGLQWTFWVPAAVEALRWKLEDFE